MINTNAVGQKRCWTKCSKASKLLMVSLIISLLKCTTDFKEPYKRAVSNWSSEEFWSVESNL